MTDQCQQVRERWVEVPGGPHDAVYVSVPARQTRWSFPIGTDGTAGSGVPFLTEEAPGATDDFDFDSSGRWWLGAQASPELHRIFIEEAPFPRRLLDAYAEKEQRLRKAWVTYLSGEVDDPDLAALMTRHLLEALAHRHTLYPPPDRTPAELESATVRMIVAYLEAERRTHTR